MTSPCPLGLLRYRSLVLLGVPALLGSAPALAQENCGDAAGIFQIDGQFYSGAGLTDWAQGPLGAGVFDDDGNPVLTPALYDRDEHWAGNAVDPDAFSGNENKNNDDISAGGEPWSWGSGSGPAKNDLTDVYAHSAQIDGHNWLFLGALTRSNNGASHIDFEFNQQGFTQVGSGSGTIVGNGADAGRTADVDFIVSVDYTEGGNVPIATFRVWRSTANGLEFVPATPDPGEVFICTNPQAVTAPPWGAVSPGGDATDTVAAYQFVEIGLDLTGLDIDPRVFCTDASTLLFKTRSAPSFTAELKDFALYGFSIVAPPSCTISAEANAVCDGQSLELCAPEAAPGADLTYAWTGPGGSFPDQRCITVDQAGIYSLVVTDNLSGCSSESCTFDLTVNPLPGCGIQADRDVICEGTTVDFCGPEGNFGYAWSGPGGSYPDQRCIAVSQPGTYHLTVTDLATGCSSSGCERTLVVNPLPPTGITGAGLLCAGASSLLCGPEGNYGYAWSGPGGPYPAERCVSVSAAGTYRLTVTDLATGCQATGEHAVLVADNPGCLISGPSSICPDGEETLCGPEGTFSYAWSGPGGPFPDQRCIAIHEAGTYTLTLEDPNGCSSVCEHAVTLDADVTAGSLEDLFLCTGERGELCVEASGTGPLVYQWSKDGEPIAGANDPCFVIPSIEAGDAGTYAVTVTGKCNAVTRSASLTLADVRVAALRDRFLCEGQPAEFCAQVSGRGPFTYQWFKDGRLLPGEADSCLKVEAVAEANEGTYCVMVTGFCGPPVEACATVLVGECVEYCGLTQGAYGNPGGKWNGLSTLELLDTLILPDAPLTLGVLGVRSVTFEEGSEGCIIDWLPGGGLSAELRSDLGDVVVDPVTCSTDPKLQGPRGRLRNSLLAQTITLALNMRLDPTLPNFPLCELVITIPILPGPDGIRGTADDVPDNDHPRIVHIAESVFHALDLLGLPHTAGGVLTLANRALAGDLPDNVDVLLGDLTTAAGSVNDLTDECALTIHCAEEAGGHADIPAPRARVFGSGEEDAALGFALASSNPVRGSAAVRVRFALAEPSRVRLALYDLAGRRIQSTPDTEMDRGEHAMEVGASRQDGLAAGMYFVRLESVGLESGRLVGVSRKLLVIP